MKGRPPDPTRARRGTGNRPKPGEAKPAKALVPKVVQAKAVAVVEPFPPPGSLPESVHDVWRNAVADLGGAGHMKPTFVPQLVAYCEAVLLHAQVSANIHEFGVLIEGERGLMPNPLIRVQKDAAATILRYADALGMTPASRIRLALEEVTGMSILASLNQTLDKR